MKIISLLLTTIVLATMFGCEPPKTTPTRTDSAETAVNMSPKEAQAIARDAYVYGFPMVMGYKTMYAYAIDRENKDYKGPFNQMSCEARVFTPQDKAVVTPNSDTPYCMFWIDLRAEPLVLTVPEMEPERFYHFQLIDLYTHNFAYVGTLTTGNGAGKYLIAGPAWDGEKPEGINAVLRSETPFVFNVTRTQLFGPDDLPKVKEIQGGYGLQPLSAFLGEDPPAAAPTPDFPQWDEGSQFDERFFAYLDFMMSLLEKPAEGKQPLWDRLAGIGVGPGGTYDFESLSPEIQDALKAGVKQGFGEIEKFIAEYSSDPLMSGKLFGTRAFLEESARTNFDLDDLSMLRSAAAHMGLYGNSAAEAIYPTYLVDADKEPLDASKHSYTVTFEQGKLPPAKSFWSLTMYDAQTQLFIENPLERYLLNSTMMEQFKLAEDGSLVFYVSNESPGPEFESNWLPAPDGPFYLVMRLYGPEKEALEGEWTPPPLQKAEASPAEESDLFGNVGARTQRRGHREPRPPFLPVRGDVQREQQVRASSRAAGIRWTPIRSSKITRCGRSRGPTTTRSTSPR